MNLLQPFWPGGDDLLNYLRGVYQREGLDEERFSASRSRLEQVLKSRQPEEPSVIDEDFWIRWGYESRDESIKKETAYKLEQSVPDRKKRKFGSVLNFLRK